jgi:Zn-dependent protease
MQGVRVFTLFGVPVFVSAWFLLVLLSWSAGSGPAFVGLTWGVAVTVSILWHEFGHAMVARRYRLAPRVWLHGWGGLCQHDRAETDGHDALIIAAGPGAGLLLGGLVWLADRWLTPLVLPGLSFTGRITWATAVEDLLHINLFWSLVNLLPLWPLDGGQLFRLGMVRWLGGARGERVAHATGLIVGLVASAIGWNVMHSTYITIGGLFLAYMNWQKLGDGSASGPIRPRFGFAKGLLAEAQAALAARNWREAARIAHQIRSLTALSDDLMRRTWEVLAVATSHLGEPNEALSYARRAPDTPAVRLARARALLELDRDAEARAELEALRKLPPALEAERAALESRLTVH